MLREQFINFLEAAVMLLLLTNAVSVLMAAYAIAIARGAIRPNMRLSQQPVLLKLFAGSVRR
jgi:hypothetical protein